jgi:hypothetical protein
MHFNLVQKFVPCVVQRRQDMLAEESGVEGLRHQDVDRLKAREIESQCGHRGHRGWL